MLSLTYRLLRDDAAQRRRRAWKLATLAVLALAPLSLTAWAASTRFPGSLSSLWRFNADDPALADEFNENFQVLGNAIVNKTGSLTGSNIDMPNGTVTFGTASRQMLNYWNTEFGTGVHPSTLYNRVNSSSAFRWYTGGSGNDAVGVNGTTERMSLSSGGLNVTNNLSVGGSLSVGGAQHRVVTLAKGNCTTAGGCSVSCPAGKVVKVGWVFAGGIDNVTIAPNATCPQVYMGNCFDQNTCLVPIGTASCQSRSAYFIECW